jgi:hypothetical protein
MLGEPVLDAGVPYDERRGVWLVERRGCAGPRTGDASAGGEAYPATDGAGGVAGTGPRTKERRRTSAAAAPSGTPGGGRCQDEGVAPPMRGESMGVPLRDGGSDVECAWLGE